MHPSRSAQRGTQFPAALAAIAALTLACSVSLPLVPIGTDLVATGTDLPATATSGEPALATDIPTLAPSPLAEETAASSPLPEPTATPLPSELPPPTPEPSAASTLDPGYTQYCVPIDEVLPEGFLAEGEIIYNQSEEQGAPEQLYGYTTLTGMRLTLAEHPQLDLVVSPDGRLLSVRMVGDYSGNMLAFLETWQPDGQTLTKHLIQPDWTYGPLYWLDDSRVVFEAFPGQKSIFLDVLTGEATTFDHSGAEFSIPYLAFPYYNSDQTLAAFERHLEGAPAQMVLRDLAAGRDLWTVVIGPQFSPILPDWEHDGDRFVIGLPLDGNSPVQQLQLIYRDGSASVLTHFPGPQIIIESPTWSPDERYIAFFLSAMNTHSLAVYDMQTMRVRDTCLRAENDSRIIWSPDSTQIAIDLAGETGGSIVVYDLEQWSAAQLFTTGRVMGWMTLLP